MENCIKKGEYLEGLRLLYVEEKNLEWNQEAARKKLNETQMNNTVGMLRVCLCDAF